MSRVNFYQLLELKINPPESNPDIIAAAIKRKQAEWSRLRNHPTKGTLARQYISLLTDIRNVMADPQLREKEARNALDLLKKKLEAKFKKIDNHVSLLCCKGDISADEIDRLADLHKVKPQIIQRRVDRWQKKHGTVLETHLNRLLIYGKPDEKTIEKIATQYGSSLDEVRSVLNKLMDERSGEIDAYINIQIRKGFMSQNEISSLAEIYMINQGDILRQIRCPIKQDSDSDIDNVYQIDSTVEQFISENLKIVEQDSLYSFLGLFPGSTLEALQAKAIDKEKETRKIAQKDAFVTASGVLAGQCITIFKTDESRYAYDLSRARMLLKNINKELDLAVNKKTIRIEYYNYLLRKAISFGTNPSEARQHILDYCREKKWKADLPKKKIDFKRYSRVAFITLGVFLIAGATFWYFYFSKQRLEAEYARTIAEANSQPSFEDQIQVYEQYLSRHDQEDLRQRALSNIESLQNRIVQRDFKAVSQSADELYVEKKYEEIDELFGQFLARHSGSAWADKIREQKAKIPSQIDERDYQNLLTIPSDQPEMIAHEGSAYLRQHPDGAYVTQVRKKISAVEPAYYRDVTKELKQYEEAKDWNQCIRLSSRYIEVYRDSRSALKLKAKRDKYQINLQNKNIITSLTAKAGGANADPDAIRRVYEDFINETPNSPAVPIIKNKLAQIYKRIGKQEADKERERLQNAFAKKEGRFSTKKKDTFYDTKTRLTWTLLDSRLMTGTCMNYEEALKNINTMKIGGYTDWRLPKAKELVGLYGATTLFEGVSSDWYWSSDRFKRYSGGWIILVDVVSPDPQPSIQKKNANACGWFRAVRP